MGTPLDRAGSFLATVADHAIQKKDSGALMLACRFNIVSAWDPENQEWTDWSGADVECYGNFTIQQKDGKVNERNVQDIARAFSWYSSDLMELATTDHTETTVQIYCKADTYQGTTSYKAAYIRHASEQVPAGGMKRATDSDLAAIQAELGGQLRALIPAKPAGSLF